MLRIASAAAARATIAAHIVGPGDAVERLGDVTLHSHQRSAIARIEMLLERHRGALLADDVGLGKTFVALAIARRAQDALVVAPAALRDSWSAAARRTGTSVRFVSIEALSRGRGVETAPLLIVDEAHHLRTANTKRYTAVLALSASSRVLLVSATPVQNGLTDLRTMLALFLGARAYAASEQELAEVIVRRLASDVGSDAQGMLPSVADPVWVHSPSDVDCLDRLIALPPPVPPSDGDDGGILLTYSLARQWASTRAALRGAVTRRLARARALEDALAAGRWPSRAELAAWQFADGAQQLTFPELMVSSKESDCARLQEQVMLHADALRDLLAWLSTSPDPDAGRADALTELVLRHAGERVVVFSEYRDSVASLFHALLRRARVAMLTHSGGRVAGGRISRTELLAQFRNHGPPARESDRVDVLISTDVLSEGVDLHAASVVVHLDLAWNPARLEQRVGRLRRLGAARDRVSVYAFAPPAPAERLLRLEQRLRVKLGAAASSVGLAGAIIPGLAKREPASPVQRAGWIEQLVRAWRATGASAGGLAAAVRSDVRGALVCARVDDRAQLLAVVDGRVSESVEDIERLARAAEGPDAPLPDRELAAVEQAVVSWMARRANAGVIDLPAAHVARARHHVLRRAQTIAQRAHRHERVRLREMLGAARAVATATLSAGAERVLDELARADMPDVAWLQSLGQFAAIHAPASPRASDQVLAILVLSPPT